VLDNSPTEVRDEQTEHNRRIQAEAVQRVVIQGYSFARACEALRIGDTA
jgi:hypothetical protein